MQNSILSLQFDPLEFIKKPEFKLSSSVAFMVSMLGVTALAEHAMDRFEIAGVSLSNSECARFIGVSEADFEAAKPEIVKRAIFRQESNGTLVYEPFEKLLARKKINQINGKKGGRGNKSTRTLTEQTYGTESQQKTGTEKAHKKRNSSQLLAKAELPAISFSKEKVSRSLATTVQKFSEEEIKSLAERAAAIPKLDPDKSKAQHAVRQWLLQGADEALVIRVLTNKKLPEDTVISSMHWYSPAISEALGLNKKGVRRAR